MRNSSVTLPNRAFARETVIKSQSLVILSQSWLVAHQEQSDCQGSFVQQGLPWGAITVGARAMTEIQHISVDELIVDSAQSRDQDTWTNGEADRRLIESVESDGVLQPCLVRPVEMTNYGDAVDESYAIIAGSRRFNASVEAGRGTVPCSVIDADDLEAAVKSLKENEQREDLSQEELASSIRMQYEMLDPTEEVGENETISCQFCEYETGSIQGLVTHQGQSDCTGSSVQQALPPQRDSVPATSHSLACRTTLS